MHILIYIYVQGLEIIVIKYVGNVHANMKIEKNSTGEVYIKDKNKNVSVIKHDGVINETYDQGLFRALRRNTLGEKYPDKCAVFSNVTQVEFKKTSIHSQDTNTGDSTTYSILPRSSKRITERSLLRYGNSISGTLLLEDDCTLSVSENPDFISVEFDSEVDVPIAFSAGFKYPTVTVPETHEGVAKAINILGNTFRFQDPNRTYPSARKYTPNVEFGDTYDIPEKIPTRSNRDITLVIPRKSYAYLAVAAPLGYYTGAEIQFGEDGKLRAGTECVSLPTDIDEFEEQVTCLLSAIHALDRATRVESGFERLKSPLQKKVIARSGINPKELSTYSLTDRLSEYLSLDLEYISELRNSWPLSLVAESSADSVWTVLNSLTKLPMVYHKDRHVRIENEEAVIKSDSRYDVRPVWDSTIGQKTTNRSQQLSVNINNSTTDSSLTVSETAQTTQNRRNGDREQDSSIAEHRNLSHDISSSVVGFAFDGVPIYGYKLTRESIENKEIYGSEGDINITIVTNSDVSGYDELQLSSGAGEEAGNLLGVYYPLIRQKFGEGNVSVNSYQGLTKSELKEVIESGADYFHFIGHCDEGLICSGGKQLKPSDIDVSRVETFLLNACGSLNVGEKLVEEGSVCGVATTERVMNNSAEKVGAWFAKLICKGFSVQSALSVACLQIKFPSQYRTIGDGTHRLSDSEENFQYLQKIDPKEDKVSVYNTADVLSHVGASIYYDNNISRSDTKPIMWEFDRCDTMIADKATSRNTPVILGNELIVEKSRISEEVKKIRENTW